MKWFKAGELQRRKRREYQGQGFSVSVVSLAPELVKVIHQRETTTLALGAERTPDLSTLRVQIPQDVCPKYARQVAGDLQSAFAAMGYPYEIARVTRVEAVDERGREAALEELRQMGYDFELSPDGNMVRQRFWVRDARVDYQKVMSLLQIALGTRPQMEILATSRRIEKRDAS